MNNVKVTPSRDVTITTSENVAANERRDKLLISAQGGIVYIKFGPTESSGANAPTSSDYHLKIADGSHFLLENFTGLVRAQNSASVTYTEFTF